MSSSNPPKRPQVWVWVGRWFRLGPVQAHPVAIQHPEPVLSILRDFAPILLWKKGKFALVTRYDDVKEVFLADDAFGVPYTEKLNVITGGVPFILGMEDSREYRRSRDAMRSVMRLDPTHKVVATDDIEIGSPPQPKSPARISSPPRGIASICWNYRAK